MEREIEQILSDYGTAVADETTVALIDGEVEPARLLRELRMKLGILRAYALEQTPEMTDLENRISVLWKEQL